MSDARWDQKLDMLKFEGVEGGSEGGYVVVYMK
jgi:hypothetical protein